MSDNCCSPKSNRKNTKYNNFTNKSGNNNPILIQTVEEEIKNIFSEKSKLNISSYGDIIIEGEIEEYKITPISVSSGEIATLNRLNIKINVKWREFEKLWICNNANSKPNIPKFKASILTSLMSFTI